MQFCDKRDLIIRLPSNDLKQINTHNISNDEIKLRLKENEHLRDNIAHSQEDSFSGKQIIEILIIIDEILRQFSFYELNS